MRVIVAVLLSTLIVSTSTAAPRRRPAPQRAKPCGTMSDATLFLSAMGQLTGCNAIEGQGCDILQPIVLTVNSFGYDFGCSSHTIVWDFGDGATVTTYSRSPVQHRYTAGGTYVVSATVLNDRSTFAVRQTVRVYEVGY